MSEGMAVECVTCGKIAVLEADESGMASLEPLKGWIASLPPGWACSEECWKKAQVGPNPDTK